MIAGILYAFEKGMSVEDALKMGAAAGAATAMSNGAEIGKKEDVEALFNKVKVSKLEPAGQ